MILKYSIVSLLLVAICHRGSAWTTVHTSVIPRVKPSCIKLNRPRFYGASSVAKASSTILCGASNENSAPKRKRKRKKKAQVVDTQDIDVANMVEKEPEPMIESVEKEPEPKVESESNATVLNLKPRDDTPVKLEVENILASESDSNTNPLGSVTSILSSIMGPKETTDGFEGMSRTSSAAINDFVDPGNVGGRDDSFDEYLQKARRMAEEEKNSFEESGLSDEEGTGIKKMIGNALSTIVTADFFLVCGFLLWFLLGIFCSYILKDDTIQIAFNNNFEKLVQPALGVLMIAAIGGNFFKGEEQEYDL